MKAPTETSPLMSPSNTGSTVSPDASSFGSTADDYDDNNDDGVGGNNCSYDYDDYGEEPSSTSRRRRSITQSFRRLSASLHNLVVEHTGSIGYLGSMAIAINSLTGPAMLNLPAMFVKAGIIPTVATLVFVCILSALCCCHLSNTVSKVKDPFGKLNHDFRQEVEFSDVFNHFWGHRWFIATQVLFFFCITCLNISSIVDTAQVVDTFFAHWCPVGAIALKISKQHETSIGTWSYDLCSEKEIDEGDCLPFAQDDGIILTIGNLVVTMVFMPLALMDLKENAFAQIIGFLVLILTSLQFVIQFSCSISLDNASWFGYDWDDLFGVILFNFALVIAIPAWLYEREPHVDVPRVIRSSSGLSLVLYVLIGLLGSLAIPNPSENMLQSMMSGSMGTSMELGASTFAFFIIGLGIPLFSVLTRLNLTGSGLCSRKVGNALAVYLPFAASWFLNDSGAVTKLLSWGGTLFVALVAFILPLVLTIYVVKSCEQEGSTPVYWGLLTSKHSELFSLYILLALTVFAVVAAILGNVIDPS